MKAFYFLLFSSLLLFINAHISVEEKNQTNSESLHTFLVKTNLTKEEIELILSQHQNKETQNIINDNAKTNLKQKKEKSHENKKEKKSDVEHLNNANNAEVQKDSIQTEKISLNIINDTTTNKNESDKFDTEDPPEPDIEAEKETSEIPETSAENAEASVVKNTITLLSNHKNGNEAKENFKLTKTNEDTAYKGITIFNCFSLILLTIIFISVMIIVTQPKKSDKFFKDTYIELSDYLLVK